MHRYKQLVVKSMDNKRLYENGIKVRPRQYEIIKMFSPHMFVGSAGRHDTDAYNDRGQHNDK
jgi:hypothetical protein